ncbi:MAG: 2-phosphosulfolactate phosphatase [Candidatus Zixiibacteriota bacterium]|nr:MAG: 2-phosphosulfolactate phosphatase [candidate division Zixibacteria bacterium]
MRIDLFLLPGSVGEHRLAGKTLVLIDVLRASTTICQALKAGARAIIPVEEPDQAAEMRQKIGAENSLLAGERQGIKIENFKLGNSPKEYTEEVVRDKTIILTTTNGTRAYTKAPPSRLIITGALVNISAIAHQVAQTGKDAVILCAGSEGDFSIEDALCGGMLVHKLESDHQLSLQLNDAASLALLLYRSNSRALAETIARGEHGRCLIELGFAEDVALASQADAIPVVPILRDQRIILEDNS